MRGSLQEVTEQLCADTHVNGFQYQKEEMCGLYVSTPFPHANDMGYDDSHVLVKISSF